MMVRTQISLDAELHNRLRNRAARLGVSLAEYIRRLVDRDLAKAPRKVDRSVIFDLGASESSDIASNKDRMIGEAFAAARKPSTGAR